MKRSNSTLASLNAPTALTHKKLDIIKHLKNGLWRRHPHDPDRPFYNIENVGAEFCHRLVLRSINHLRFDQDPAFLDMEMEIFNMLVAFAIKKKTKQLEDIRNGVWKSFDKKKNTYINWSIKEIDGKNHLPNIINDTKHKIEKIARIASNVPEILDYKKKIQEIEEEIYHLLHKEAARRHALESQNKIEQIQDKLMENTQIQETGSKADTPVSPEIPQKESLLPIGLCVGTVDSTNKYKKIMVSNLCSQTGIKGGEVYKYKYIVLTLTNGEYKPQLLNSNGQLKSLEEIAQLNEPENGWVSDIQIKNMIKKGKIRETEMAKKAEEKDAIEKNSAIFLTYDKTSDKPVDNSKPDVEKRKPPVQAFFKDEVHGDYKILEVITAFAGSVKKTGELSKSLTHVKGYKYIVSFKGQRIPVEYSQSELINKIKTNKREIAYNKTLDKQYDLDLKIDTKTKNKDVIVNHTEISSDKKIQCTQSELNAYITVGVAAVLEAMNAAKKA